MLWNPALRPNVQKQLDTYTLRIQPYRSGAGNGSIIAALLIGPKSVYIQCFIFIPKGQGDQILPLTKTTQWRKASGTTYAITSFYFNISTSAFVHSLSSVGFHIGLIWILRPLRVSIENGTIENCFFTCPMSSYKAANPFSSGSSCGSLGLRMNSRPA